MNEFEVSAIARTEMGKSQVRRLRKRGLVPGILYGGGVDPTPIHVKDNELRKSLENEAFFSHILTVNVDGTATQAVLKDMQRDPGTYEVRHVDFMRVRATEELTMRVPLHFLNEDTCPGAKNGGIVSHLMTELEINCLPRHLPEYIEVDLAGLDIGDSLHISDVTLPEGVSLTHAIDDPDSDHTLVSIQQARELEVEPEDEEAEGEDETGAPEADASAEPEDD